MKRTLLLFTVVFFSIGNLFSQGFQVTGDAVALNANTYRLTQDLQSQIGAIWYKLRHNFDQNFSVEGSFFFGDADNGADGIVFVLQNQCLLDGVDGFGMGYHGLPGQSLGIEFDTYRNGGVVNDPTYDHIAIHRDGTVNHNINLAGPVKMSATQTNTEDNNWHTYKIEYNPTLKKLKVFFDGSLRISYSIDITNTIFGGNPYAYWGFTSATGAFHADNSVSITDFTSIKLEDATICGGGTQVILPPLDATNMAEGKQAYASSIENPGMSANRAFDNSYSTRWSSQFSNQQWITVDLGSQRDIDSVYLHWEAAYGSKYKIQTSNDNATWTDRFQETAGNGGLDKIYFAANNVRYVRMLGIQRATNYGYSLYEFEVFGPKQYTWGPNDGTIDDINSNSPTFTPSVSTTYTLTVPDDCVGSTDFNFDVIVDCTVLPIELIDFTAKLNGRQVDLNWQTASEINNAYFEVERSLNGLNWEVIEKVNGAGNSSEVLSYQTVDQQLNWIEDGYYYRLKQVDFDHAFTYSDIQYVQLNKMNVEIELYPNPAHDQIHLVGEDLNVSAIHISDLAGKNVSAAHNFAVKSNGHLVIDISDFAPGVYMLNAGSISKRFVKQ